MDRREKVRALAGLCLIFTLAFCFGSFAGRIVSMRDMAVSALPAEQNWGLSFQEEGKPPVANADFEELGRYDAFYAEDTQEKVLYLTFDCGFENGNTPAILDALKKHSAPAAFFVVGNYVETSPELVKRMVAEGHTVGNHSYHHPNMSSMGKEEFQKSSGSWKRSMSGQSGKKW